MSEPFDRYHVRVFRNKVYAPLDWSGFDPEKHQLDVYVPVPKIPTATTETFPVILFIHGGAWMFGDRADSKPRDVGKCMARCGYVTVVASYRLSQVSHSDVGELAALLAFIFLMVTLSKKQREKVVWMLLGILCILIFMYVELQMNPRQNRHPCHIHDCAQALLWIQNHIAQYGGDRERIVLMGHSAGGHLSALLAMDHQYLRQYNIPVQYIKAVICISGVYSDVRMKNSRIGIKVCKTIFGRKKSKWVEAFPINHVGPHNPPVLLLNAEFECGLKVHAYDFLKALKQAGIHVEQHCFKGLNHFNIITFWTQEHRKITYVIDSFMQRIL